MSKELASAIKSMHSHASPWGFVKGPASLPIMSRCDCQIGQHRPDRARVDVGAE
jgi:hypothetical protein